MLLPISGKRAAKAEARGLESPEMSMTGGYRNETKKLCKAWTSDDDERLRQLVVSNSSLSNIADDLGRTVSAVRARAHALRIALGHSRFIRRRQTDQATSG
jgi:hypothetical protein